MLKGLEPPDITYLLSGAGPTQRLQYHMIVVILLRQIGSLIEGVNFYVYIHNVHNAR